MKAKELAKEIRDMVWNYGDDPVGIIADLIRPHILEGRCIDCIYYSETTEFGYFYSYCIALKFDFDDNGFKPEEIGCNLWGELPEAQE